MALVGAVSTHAHWATGGCDFRHHRGSLCPRAGTFKQGRSDGRSDSQGCAPRTV